MTDALAHSGGHLLAAHLQSVAKMAADFSATFEPATATRRWAYLGGLWRHSGRCRCWFRNYVQFSANTWSSHVQ